MNEYGHRRPRRTPLCAYFLAHSLATLTSSNSIGISDPLTARQLQDDDDALRLPDVSADEVWTYPRAIGGTQTQYIGLVLLNETHFVATFQDPSGAAFVRLGSRDKLWDPIAVTYSRADNLRILRLDCKHVVVGFTGRWSDHTGSGKVVVLSVDPKHAATGLKKHDESVFNGGRTDSLALAVSQTHGLVLAYVSIFPCDDDSCTADQGLTRHEVSCSRYC